MRFEWDEAKNERNLLKHNVRFETAALVFDDPFALTQRDESSDKEERWITFGTIGERTILVVVHTWLEAEGEEVIRIISARTAETREKRAYEEAYQGAKKRHRRPRSHERRRY
jgi:uncharacterized DUF497 family protein